MNTEKKIVKFTRKNNQQTFNGMVFKLKTVTHKDNVTSKYGTLMYQYDDGSNGYISLDVTAVDKELAALKLDPISNGDIITITGTVIKDKDPYVSKENPDKLIYNEKLRYYTYVRIDERVEKKNLKLINLYSDKKINDDDSNNNAIIWD